MGSGIRVVGAAPTADEHDAGSTKEPDDAAVATDAAVSAVATDVPEADTDVPESDTGAPVDAGPGPVRRRRRWRVGAGRPQVSTGRGRGFLVACVIAVLGVAGTIVFGVAWAGVHAQQVGEAQAKARAKAFLVDLTNFDAKTVDADFAAITSMATGSFAGQAGKFFNSSIRQELQRALASSRGQVRELYVQSYGVGQASVYAVVTQLYTNSKITTPQSDVLRIVADMRQAGGTWKVADVTVLEGPSLSSGSTAASGSAGSPSTTGSAG